ncbi:histidine phosphatase family protein [Convivina intestini]|uniref:histidine phosphatase family protein n=1 Tax=Convivina intestini TaxID=1505726 RepID=UPI00200F5DEB|nr:histidine phosphatase family protein [Convivina intestini]CAH1853948.1 2,3-bisphosphoglycerate-dependent phosphoglycerate mutase [Convivina intestini]
MAITIYMVRHGETYFNLTRRFQGHSDAPLTTKGIQDAHQAGQRLAKVAFDGAYSSDLTRAIHTARFILAENQTQSPKEPVQLPDFREENFGSFEGIDSQVTVTYLNGFVKPIYSDYSAMVAGIGMQAVMDLFHDHDPYQLAENYQHFYDRVQHGFELLRQAHQDGDQILVVAHGTTIRAIADMFGRSDLALNSVKNGAVMQLSLTDTTAEVISFNDTETYF